MTEESGIIGRIESLDGRSSYDPLRFRPIEPDQVIVDVLVHPVHMSPLLPHVNGIGTVDVLQVVFDESVIGEVDSLLFLQPSTIEHKTLDVYRPGPHFAIAGQKPLYRGAVSNP